MAQELHLSSLMKKIEAIVRPSKWMDLKKALIEADIHDFTVSDLGGVRKSMSSADSYELDASAVLPKIGVVLFVDDAHADSIAQIIIKTCSTGESGDGKVFILPVENAFRIRDGKNLI